MTRGQVAAKVRQEKEKFPHRFCPDKKCLFRIDRMSGAIPCPKHQPMLGPYVQQQQQDRLRGVA